MGPAFFMIIKNIKIKFSILKTPKTIYKKKKVTKILRADNRKKHFLLLLRIFSNLKKELRKPQKFALKYQISIL